MKRKINCQYNGEGKCKQCKQPMSDGVVRRCVIGRIWITNVYCKPKEKCEHILIGDVILIKCGSCPGGAELKYQMCSKCEGLVPSKQRIKR